MRRLFTLSLIVVFTALMLLFPLGKAQAAGSVSGVDMINLMNSWRANSGYSSLVEDPTLTYCAQWTAEEMSRIGAYDHLKNIGYLGASERCPGHGFVTENWAYNPNMTLNTLAGYWADHDHMLPATDPQYVTVGVGISNGYYILQAGSKMGDGSVIPTSSSDGTGVSPYATDDLSNYINPVITSTPNADGAIYHVVQSGQFLDAIAQYYGVPYGEIKTLNSLASDAIYAGQKLLIRLAPTATITPTRTPTVVAPTRTPTNTPMPTTPRPTRTVTPTLNPNVGNLFPKIDRQWIGLGLLILSAVGFFVVFYFLFLKAKPKSKDNDSKE